MAKSLLHAFGSIDVLWLRGMQWLNYHPGFLKAIIHCLNTHWSDFSSLCNCAIVSMSYPLIILSTKPLFATIWHSSLFARDILACVRSNTRCQEVNKFITITCSEHFFGLSLFAIFHEEIVDFVYDVINSFL